MGMIVVAVGGVGVERLGAAADRDHHLAELAGRDGAGDPAHLPDHHLVGQCRPSTVRSSPLAGGSASPSMGLEHEHYALVIILVLVRSPDGVRGAGRRHGRPARPGWRRRPRPPAPDAGQWAPAACPRRTSRRRRVSSGWRLELAADGPAVEHQQVQRDAGEAQAQAVEHGDEPHAARTRCRSPRAPPSPRPRTASSRRRPSPVGYSHTPRVGPLHQQDLALVVADDRADRHLRRDVAGHAFADDSIHSSTQHARASSSSPAAARMSAATFSTSSNRSRS